MTWRVDVAWCDQQPGEDTVWVTTLASAVAYAMPPSGLAILAGCDGAASVQEAVEAVIRREGWSGDGVADEVARFIRELLAAGLIETDR